MRTMGEDALLARVRLRKAYARGSENMQVQKKKPTRDGWLKMNDIVFGYDLKFIIRIGFATYRACVLDNVTIARFFVKRDFR